MFSYLTHSVMIRLINIDMQYTQYTYMKNDLFYNSTPSVYEFNFDEAIIIHHFHQMKYYIFYP